MVHPSTACCTLILLLSSSGGRAAQDEGQEEEPSLASAAETPAEALPPGPPVLALEDLRRDPLAWIDQPVRIVVQFHSLEQRFHPYLTRFSSVHFLAVRAWSDEQRPWIEAEYLEPALRVFAPRADSGLIALLEGARQHQRFELTVRVRDLLLGRVWAEVQSARRLAEEISEGTVVHRARAGRLMARGDFAHAAGEVERALAAPLPPAARRELQETLTQCRALAGRAGQGESRNDAAIYVDAATRRARSTDQSGSDS